MAELACAMAAIHLPSLLSAPQRLTEAQWAAIRGGFAVLRETLTAHDVDTIVVISDEHFNTLDPRCYPSFGVVTDRRAQGPVESWLGVPRGSIDVALVPELAEAVLEQGMADRFDLTRLSRIQLDHGFLTCLHFMTPQWDHDYVWLIQNCVLPPLPSVRRSYEFGQMVGRAIRRWDSPRRVAVLGTGGLSHWVGTPEAGRIDEAFDRRVMALLGENGPALAALTHDELEAAGNGAHEVRNWVAAAGAAGGAGEVVMYEPVAGCGSGMMRWQVA